MRTRIDDQSYKIRFTPRKPSSTWSAINIERVAAATGHPLKPALSDSACKKGRCRPAPRAAVPHQE